MSSKIFVKVEFLPGTRFEDAVNEAKSKAALWDVCSVLFDFNGISISIKRDADIDSAVEQYHQAMTGKSKITSVIA